MKNILFILLILFPFLGNSQFVIYPYGLFGTDTIAGGGGTGGACGWNTTGYTQTFFTGYNTVGDITIDGNGQYGLEPPSAHVSTSIFHTGPASFLSIPANVSSGIRSEVQYGTSNQNNDEGVVEYYVFYTVVIPDNGHSFQWHPNTSGGSASPGLWHIGGRFVMVNWKNGGNSEYPTGITIQTNHWYNIRMEYKFGTASGAGQGYFRLYIDCVLRASWVGEVGDGSGQYMKVGYNGWDGNSTSSRIYYDDLTIWRKN